MNDAPRPPDNEREAYRVDAQLLSDLWIFRAAARFGSITAAARHLNVTQGAVSQRVLRLEARLGVELFHRLKGRIVLTEAGSRMLATMDTVSSEVNQALGSIRRPQRGALVVSCAPSLATEWLMPHLQDFYRECPQIELRVRAEMSVRSAKWMEAERIDVLIDYLHAEAPDLHQLASVQELTFPVCSRAYRARLDSLPAEERSVVLMHDDAAWREGEVAGAEWQERLSSTACRTTLAVEGERHFNLAYLAYQAAVYGQGVAIGRSISVNRLLHSGDLVAASDEAPLPSAHYRVFALAPVAADSPAQRFSAWLVRALARTQQDSLEWLRESLQPR